MRIEEVRSPPIGVVYRGIRFLFSTAKPIHLLVLQVKSPGRKPENNVTVVGNWSLTVFRRFPCTSTKKVIILL